MVVIGTQAMLARVALCLFLQTLEFLDGRGMIFLIDTVNAPAD